MIQTHWVGGSCPVAVADIESIKRKLPPPKPVRVIVTKTEKRKAKEPPKKLGFASALNVDVILKVIREHPGSTTAAVMREYHKADVEFSHRTTLRAVLQRLDRDGLIKETKGWPEDNTGVHTKPCSMWSIR